jgi:hypothetical protein
MALRGTETRGETRLYTKERNALQLSNINWKTLFGVQDVYHG